MVSSCPIISNSSSRLIDPFEIVPRAPFTFGVAATFMFHSLFLLLLFFLVLSLSLWSTGTTFFALLLLFTYQSFSHQRLADGFHWSLSDNKSPRVSRILSIRAVLHHVVVWKVYTRPPTSMSSSPFSNPLVTVPITIGIIVICMFHSFFNSLARPRYLSVFSYSFNFILWSAETAKSTILQVLYFCWLLLSLVFWPRLSDPLILFLFTPLEFFTSVLADGFSLEFEGQQVSSSLHNSSQDSGRS